LEINYRSLLDFVLFRFVSFRFVLCRFFSFPALKLHSPIHIVRPIIDVHTNCDQDVQKYCSQISTHIQQDSLLYSHKYLLETNEDGSPSPRNIASSNASGNTDNDKSLGYDPTYDSDEYDQKILSYANEDTKEGEDARRLSEVESKQVSASRKYSISVRIHTTPNTLLEEATQHSKDNTRFLNYGSNIDMCLWNAFDAQHVSSQCASALAYLNGSDDSLPYHYTNDSEPRKIYKKISISLSGVTLGTLILCYLLIRKLFCECDDNARDGDQSDFDHDEYQYLNESKSIAFVAVPVKIV